MPLWDRWHLSNLMLDWVNSCFEFLMTQVEIFHFTKEFSLGCKIFGVKNWWPLFIVRTREEYGVLETKWARFRNEAFKGFILEVAILLELLDPSWYYLWRTRVARNLKAAACKFTFLFT